MRIILLAASVSLAIAATPAAAEATDSELAVLRQQVQALLERIEQLERAVATQPAGTPAEERLVERFTDAGTVADDATGQADSALAAVKDLDWARRIRWMGDLRYRHEQFDIEGAASDRARHRVRARFGLEAALSETVGAVVRLSTGDLDDPRSGNATLDDANRRKEVALDLAYLRWAPYAGAALTLGKQPKPWFEPGNALFYDGDVSPEGVAFSWAGGGGAFATVWGLWLDESSAQADANLTGAQLGYAFDRLGLTLAAGYWNYGAIRRQPLLGFAGAPAGNSTYLAGADCEGTGTTPCYLYDYDIVGLDAAWTGKVGTLPLTLFAGVLKNVQADALNTGYTAGAQLGKAGDPGSWELGALYQRVERDAQFGALLESDFAGGVTQSGGWQVVGAWAPARNLSLKATVFLNDVGYDTPEEFDYRRLQLDLNLKF